MFWILSMMLGLGCVITYGEPETEPAASRDEMLTGADFAALDARLLLLLEDNTDRDREIRLEASRELLRQARHWPRNAQDDLMAYMFLMLDVEERVKSDEQLEISTAETAAVEVALSPSPAASPVATEEPVPATGPGESAAPDESGAGEPEEDGRGGEEPAVSAAGAGRDPSPLGGGETPQPATAEADEPRPIQESGESAPTGSSEGGAVPEPDSGEEPALDSGEEPTPDTRGQATESPAPDPEHALEQARTALADGRFEEALRWLERVDAAHRDRTFAGLHQEAVDGWVHQERERAGQMFLRARTLPTGEQRKAALEEVRTLLVTLLEEHPESSYAGALRRNLAFVERELDRL